MQSHQRNQPSRRPFISCHFGVAMLMPEKKRFG
jgi:hypothetical protein